ncbi:hypothetical protein [Deinococcus sp.]|uniref:hypothetical protein n=1 Tax=Deinococcus sp. TaxID=47478 RepID=UPI0025EC24D1|nr:hypothetical protein [Deinococcus sp.]
MYDDLYDSEGGLEPCDEPGERSLHLGLHWDDGNRQHFRERLRLSPDQVNAGIAAGYLFLEPDEIGCRFRYLFRPEPSLYATSQMPVYRLEQMS